ncbi:ribonuclease P protein component [Pseudohoeflea coraliihabitans]|uniref:Ribonuclease P protein component n=1 Tax=Pseudohoeflea coraliihabitans TaxID=2860393 RepID=A0ABS6WNN3_9HYPH|nr:ribonuclease P protein component [Pseudohoeflea sp. DP4N28-3]MBW3097567.1 ribonuclease P protein component [Pseudohoeflea sp. DP4N28-3]
MSESTRPGRLKRRPDFLAVQKGLRLRGPFFQLELLDRHRPDEPPRVGLTVTRRQGNSVERNRMKRRLREAVRTAEGVSFRAGHDYVLVARRETLSASFDRLTEALAARVAEGHRKISNPDAAAGRRPGAQSTAKAPA